MPLTSVFALLFVGQLLTVVLAQGNCPQRILSETCTRANQIRSSRECVRGNETGAQRPLNDPPTSEYANNCMCTTSYYSVVSACELCNGRQPVTWHVWSQNCKQFAQNGPDNYPIQYSDWAKLTYQDQERFSVDRLRREGYLDEPQQPQPQPQPQPEPQPSPQPAPGTTSTRAGPPPTTAAPTAVPTSVNSTSSSTDPSALSDSSISGEDTSTSLSQSGSSSASLPIISQSRSSALRNNPNVPNPSDDPFGLGPAAATRGAGNTGTDPDNSFDSNSGKPLNVGAIVGGVVGGLFLLLLIAAFLFFFVLRRRRNRIPASAAYMAQFGDSRVVSARSVPLHSTSNSIENARPESPTLPRSSVDAFNPYSDSSPVTATNPHPVQDPFNPPPENHAEMRENNNMSRQSIRRYTRTPTPLIGPRPR